MLNLRKHLNFISLEYVDQFLLFVVILFHDCRGAFLIHKHKTYFLVVRFGKYMISTSFYGMAGTWQISLKWFEFFKWGLALSVSRQGTDWTPFEDFFPIPSPRVIWVRSMCNLAKYVEQNVIHLFYNAEKWN